VGLLFGDGGGEDDSFVGHIESAVGYQLSAVSQLAAAERVALQASL
jgi:hypothetical protein